jgi:hypothetical protein
MPAKIMVPLARATSKRLTKVPGETKGGEMREILRSCGQESPR